MSVHVFGIRHHGPGCARALRRAQRSPAERQSFDQLLRLRSQLANMILDSPVELSTFRQKGEEPEHFLYSVGLTHFL